LAGERFNYGLNAYFPEHELSGQNRELAERQMQVLKIMEGHYLKLLEAEGDKLQELVKNAYQSPEQFRSFLDRLEKSEIELNDYLLQEVHTSEESRLVVRQVESQSAQLREEEISLFFA
jgi:hypothetical protein